jgi:hypothetical protein
MQSRESKFKQHGLLHDELSYKVQGAIYNVASKYGKGLKESIYQQALTEELTKQGIKFEEQKRINIYKVIIELKASDFTTKKDENQQLSYLKASEYEVAYLVNFCTPRLYIKRILYTNDRKPFITRLMSKPNS